MPTYGYQAVSKNGSKKKGSIAANDLQQARQQLINEGLTPIELKEQNFLNKDINIPLFEGVKSRDLSVFCHQFVSVIDAGVSVAEALNMLGQQTENKTLRNAIFQTQKEIQQGETLADAMRKQGKRVFAPMFVNMVAAGEASGNLSVAFTRMADYYENANKTKAALKKAMIYPKFGWVLRFFFVQIWMSFPNLKGFVSMVQRRFWLNCRSMISALSTCVPLMEWFSRGTR